MVGHICSSDEPAFAGCLVLKIALNPSKSVSNKQGLMTQTLFTLQTYSAPSLQNLKWHIYLITGMITFIPENVSAAAGVKDTLASAALALHYSFRSDQLLQEAREAPP